MKILNSYLLDSDFLKLLDQEKNKKLRVRITALTWEEFPIESIEGEITGGSINIDGNSIVRRTCSLSMLAKNINLDSFYQGLNSKIFLEVGIVNTLKDYYPDDVIWIPQGVFILTNFSSSISVNNYTINLSGKDKMCLLNGEVSGSLNASIDFGTEEYFDLETKTTTYNKIPLVNIIRNIIHTYGQEPQENIIINDLDLYGYELLKYRGDSSSPLYLLRDWIKQNDDTFVPTSMFSNMTLNSNQPCWTPSQSSLGQIQQYETGVIHSTDDKATLITLTDEENAQVYSVRKIGMDDTVGYKYTDLTYAGDLISSIGENITSILDKIKNMLGNYEYFYDVYGRFVFQQKKNNLYNNWTPVVTSEGEDGLEIYVDPEATDLAYTFYGSNLFTSISHTPNFTKIRNDFSIWGERPAASGIKIPVHLRYALHTKPVKYISPYSNKEYSVTEYDWREIIYQMAVDYYKYNMEEDFVYKIGTANYEYYPQGLTGYEMFYSDMISFWRDLYNPDFIQINKKTDEPSNQITYYNLSNNKYNKVNNVIQIKDWYSLKNSVIFYSESGNEYVPPETSAQTFDENKKYFIKNDEGKLEPFNIYEWKNSNTDLYYRNNDGDFQTGPQFWHNDVFNAPTNLNFWFEFLGEGSELGKYSIPAIGDRTKAINDKDITSIYFKETPDILMIFSDEEQSRTQGQDGYTYIRINDSLKSAFSISGQGKSAFQVLEEALYEYTQCNESISINAIPIYYLQPNSRISISDNQSKIYGEFIISKITLPLTYNGTMQIQATKAINTIY